MQLIIFFKKHLHNLFLLVLIKSGSFCDDFAGHKQN